METPQKPAKLIEAGTRTNDPNTTVSHKIQTICKLQAVDAAPTELIER